ncbi:hypothetical protein ACNI3K_10895 [Demequina sp. SO4-13]|uniref:hypothetical protein n=1 Tax=Demequina sp. SO4-13 TaxID=3401027 RepID=UPI003AF89047
MSKLALLIVGGAGYLLGSRAGREHYEKFTEQAQRFMQDPRVQKGAEQAKRTVKRKADEVADGGETRDTVGGGTTTGTTAGAP